jgi:hypothetical protein
MRYHEYPRPGYGIGSGAPLLNERRFAAGLHASVAGSLNGISRARYRAAWADTALKGMMYY